jgi:glycosyltransferase involved in cell wall biosynthesis
MHNGFDVTKYRPANVVMRAAAKTSLGFHEDDFVLGCVGRVKFHRKGQEHLLEAVRLLRNKGIPAKGLVAGGNPPGSPQETERMRNLAEVLGIAEHICFAGEREQVEGMYHAMDVFVLPSAQPEPFGGVVLEAMCHELPVVATRLGGSVEQVEEGVTGFLVPPEKGEAIADACARLYVYPALRSAMGRAGRERVQTCFPLEKHLDSIDLLYQELLKGSTP